MTNLLQSVSARTRQFILDDSLSVDRAIDKAMDEAIEQSQVSLQEEHQVRNSVTNSIQGYGVLQAFLDDEGVEEIWINAPDEVRIARNGAVEVVSVSTTAGELASLVERMLRSTGRRLDRSTPFVDASLGDGSRLHVVIPEITRDHWAINIRKFPSQALLLSDLVLRGAIHVDEALFLSEAVKAGKNILVSGGTHTGKTTLLSALLAEVHDEMRVVSVEETFELNLPNSDWVAMQTRQANLEGVGEVTLRRLIKEALRMRPNRLVVGEVREAESLDLLIALNSGMPGACTIHANSAAEALLKIRTLPLLAGQNISTEFVDQAVAACIDLVVHCSISADGFRRVTEIAKVVLDSDTKPIAKLLTFDRVCDEMA